MTSRPIGQPIPGECSSRMRFSIAVSLLLCLHHRRPVVLRYPSLMISVEHGRLGEHPARLLIHIWFSAAQGKENHIGSFPTAPPRTTPARFPARGARLVTLAMREKQGAEEPCVPGSLDPHRAIILCHRTAPYRIILLPIVGHAPGDPHIRAEAISERHRLPAIAGL